jgi:hypothetical protein
MLSAVLAIFFDGAHWRALYESRLDGRLSFAEHVFGAEPSDPEVWAWWSKARLQMSSSVPTTTRGPAASQSRAQKMRQAIKSLGRGPVTEEMRAAARAARQERRKAEKIAARQNKSAMESEHRVIEAAKRKEKKRGH